MRLINNLLAALTDPGEAATRGWWAPLLNLFQTLGLLAARLYIARVFFVSGLTKLRDWDITLALFQDEYHVPFLPPEVAAYMGTGGELGLSALLVLGVGGRFAALGLSIVNLMAALSLEEIAPAALLGHQLWGVLLLVIALWGPGAVALDRWLHPWLTRRLGWA
ncbi:MAG TPA: DoxX family protein [Burkholderiaceae bacterium]